MINIFLLSFNRSHRSQHPRVGPVLNEKKCFTYYFGKFTRTYKESGAYTASARH